MKFVHQYDFNGNHRLVVNGNEGEWSSYQGIAENGDYRATTEYYGESVFKVITQEATIEGVCRVCGKPLPKAMDSTMPLSEAELADACEHVRSSVASIEQSLASIRKGK